MCSEELPELPDLVIELVIEFAAESTPISKWGELCVVCKRWKPIAIRTLRELMRSHRFWPRLLPESVHFLTKDPDKGVNISDDWTEMKQNSDDKNVWSLVAPIPLPRSGPISVKFVPSSGLGVIVGCFVFPSADSVARGIPEWDPHVDEWPKDVKRIPFSVMGCFSGYCYSATPPETEIVCTQDGGITEVDRTPYIVEYDRGNVNFTAGGMLHSTGKIDADWVTSHAENPVLCFAVAITVSNTSARVFPAESH